MALSRMALLAGAALAASPAHAQPPALGADAVEAQRGDVRAVAVPDCPEPTAEEIVVCGRREEEEARRFRVAPTPYAPGLADRAGGAQLEAMEAGDTRCSTVGLNQNCGGGLDVIGVGMTIIRGIRAIRARRD